MKVQQLFTLGEKVNNLKKIITFIKSKLNNEQGVSFILVLILIVTMSVLAVGVIGVTATNVKMSSGERDHQSVYYIAEAGINMRLDEIKSELNDATFSDFDGTDEPHPYGDDDFETNMGEQPTATVEVVDVDENGIYTIQSIGEIGNRKRIIEAQFEIIFPEDDPPPQFYFPNNTSVHSNGKITLSGSATINGSVSTSGPNSGITTSGSAHITGNIIENYQPDFPPLPHEVIDGSSELYPFNFPSYPAPADKKTGPRNHDVVLNGDIRINDSQANGYIFNLDQNYSIGEIIINSNRNLIIDVGESNKEIVVDHLNLINGHIKIQGEGSLTIYVNNEITLGSSSSINNNGEIDQLNIYFKGSELSLEGGQVIYGSFYGKETNLNFTRGAGFRGHIITGGTSVLMNGGFVGSSNNLLYYAPNANVTIENGAHLRGSIIVNELVMSGGTSITYLDPKDIDFPFFPTDPEKGEDAKPFLRIISINEK